MAPRCNEFSLIINESASRRRDPRARTSARVTARHLGGSVSRDHGCTEGRGGTGGSGGDGGYINVEGGTSGAMAGRGSGGSSNIGAGAIAGKDSASATGGGDDAAAGSGGAPDGGTSTSDGGSPVSGSAGAADGGGSAGAADGAGPNGGAGAGGVLDGPSCPALCSACEEKSCTAPPWVLVVPYTVVTSPRGFAGCERARLAHRHRGSLRNFGGDVVLVEVQPLSAAVSLRRFRL